MKYTIGTRGSTLALAQTGMVRDTLEARYPNHEFEIKIIKTTGDKNQTSALSGIGTRGVFVKEIEEQLISGEIDLAVHSMKDMPAEQPDGLRMAPCWKREDPRDALILRTEKELRPGMKIGTGSLRRVTQLRAMCEDVECVGLRGNIDTRLRKMETEGLDGIVLAAAGLKRLGLEGRITRYLEADDMIPAAAQGTLALEYRGDRDDVRAMLAACSDPETDRAVAAERHFLKLMGGGCFLPVGAYAEVIGEKVRLRAVFGDAEGRHIDRADVTAEDPIKAAQLASNMVKKQM